MKKLNMMYFSPTGTTEKIIKEIGQILLDKEDLLKGDIIQRMKRTIQWI